MSDQGRCSLSANKCLFAERKATIARAGCLGSSPEERATSPQGSRTGGSLRSTPATLVRYPFTPLSDSTQLVRDSTDSVQTGAGATMSHETADPDGRPSATQYDVLGLGAVAVDDLLYVDAYPAPESKVRLRHRLRQCGGLTGTALVAAARLGARCAYAGLLGHDELSAYVIEGLRRGGGGGDVFHGAYAAALSQGETLPRRIALAAAAAALKATHRGGQAGIPTRQAVEESLRRCKG